MDPQQTPFHFHNGVQDHDGIPTASTTLTGALERIVASPILGFGQYGGPSAVIPFISLATHDRAWALSSPLSIDITSRPQSERTLPLRYRRWWAIQRATYTYTRIHSVLIFPTTATTRVSSVVFSANTYTSCAFPHVPAIPDERPQRARYAYRISKQLSPKPRGRR